LQIVFKHTNCHLPRELPPLEREALLPDDLLGALELDDLLGAL
jgi:hypothetical protein